MTYKPTPQTVADKMGIELTKTRGSFYAATPVRCGGCGRQGRWLVDDITAWCPGCGGGGER